MNFWVFMWTLQTGLRSYMVGLRGGNRNEAYNPNDAASSYYALCYEIGLGLSTVWKALEPAAAAAVTTWAMQQLLFALKELSKSWGGPAPK